MTNLTTGPAQLLNSETKPIERGRYCFKHKTGETLSIIGFYRDNKQIK